MLKFLVAQSTRETTGLLESPNEVTIKVNGITASALLDTGSTVSTVSESFYLQYLAKQSIQTLDRILHIECANGEEMPYLGYITVDLELQLPPYFEDCLSSRQRNVRYHGVNNSASCRNLTPKHCFTSSIAPKQPTSSSPHKQCHYRTITVSPNTILCELQPVSVADIDLPEDTSSDVQGSLLSP
jgi:hypothetical protein